MYAPYIKPSDDKLSKVCQIALFFSLVSSIALKMERDTSSEALGVLLIFTLAVPPVLGFFFQSDIDFDQHCDVLKLRQRVKKAFHTWVGKHLIHALKATEATKPNIDSASPGPSTLRPGAVSGKRAAKTELLPYGSLTSDEVEVNVLEDVRAGNRTRSRKTVL